eukprot:1433550-Prymnesium_polylepis.1
MPELRALQRAAITCRSWRRYISGELRPVNWSPTMYELCEHDVQWWANGLHTSVAALGSRAGETTLLCGLRSCRANCSLLSPPPLCCAACSKRVSASSSSRVASPVEPMIGTDQLLKVSSSGEPSCSMRMKAIHSFERMVRSLVAYRPKRSSIVGTVVDRRRSSSNTCRPLSSLSGCGARVKPLPILRSVKREPTRLDCSQLGSCSCSSLSSTELTVCSSIVTLRSGLAFARRSSDRSSVRRRKVLAA